MNNYETIERDGKLFVLVPKEDFPDVTDNADYQAILGNRAADEENYPAEFVMELLAAQDAGTSPLPVWRKYRGLTQQQLAERAGDISRVYIAQIETGSRRGAPDILKRIARVLNVSLDDIV